MDNVAERPYTDNLARAASALASGTGQPMGWFTLQHPTELLIVDLSRGCTYPEWVSRLRVDPLPGMSWRGTGRHNSAFGGSCSRPDMVSGSWRRSDDC